MSHRFFAVIGTLLAVSSTSILADDDDVPEENPITMAADAFGTSVGGESIGLYQAGNVRGFSPVDAGNVRMDGLYFDQQAAFTGRLVSGTTIRVGPTTLGDPFPAPTGIADVRLRRPGSENSLRIAPQINSYGSTQVEIDVQTPISGERFGLAGGIGVYEHRYPEGGDSSVISAALIPLWQPTEGVEILPFWSHTDTRDMDITPLVLVDGPHLPPEISRRSYAGQRWASIDRTRSTYGILGTTPVANWTLRAGLFRSIENPTRSFSLQFRDTAADGSAERVVVANPSQYFASTSGELRLSRSLVNGPRTHVFHVSTRSREQLRRFGGADRMSLGPGQIGRNEPIPEPEFRFGPQTRDEVHQWTGSIAYEGRWTDVGEISLGIQKADYKKQVSPPEGALPDTKDTPWLYNASAAAHLHPTLALYGNYSRGLEESPVAPEAASNRDEAPPAVETEQTDFGLRWQAPGNFQVITGLFRIDKPYFSMDREQIFRQLGKRRHQGLELSVSGQPFEGLTIISGAVMMDPTVQIEKSETGIFGDRPVGSSRTHLLGTIDYRPPSIPDLSIDLAVEYTGKRPANLDNTLNAPAAANFDFGLRYRFEASGIHGTLRLRALNVFDTFVWDVRGNNTFGYNSPRQVSMRVTLEF